MDNKLNYIPHPQDCTYTNGTLQAGVQLVQNPNHWIAFYISIFLRYNVTRVRCITCRLIVRVGDCLSPKTGATQYHHAYLGLPGQKSCKQSAIVCCSIAKINDLLDESMDKCKLRGLVPCCNQHGYHS